MPSRKQRRRRQKGRRHEWEYVYVDDEGQEVAVEEVEQPKPRLDPRAASTAAKGVSPKAKARPPQSGTARKVPAPSWERVFKRAAIFAPVMLVAIAFLAKNITWTAR